MLSKVIRDARLAAGLSQAGLGHKLGLSDAAVNHWESGKSEPSRKHLAALIETLGLDPAVVVASSSASQPATTAAPARARLRTPIPDIQDMPRKTPILGLAQGGDGDDMFYLNGQVADYARTPPRIAGRANVFAIWTSGDSMFPWRASGDLVYVEERPVRIGDYVILEMQPDAHDTRPAILKRLAGQTPTKIRLEQYNPQKTIEIDRRKIVRMLRVIDWPELLG